MMKKLQFNMLALFVLISVFPSYAQDCGAYIAPGKWKKFMCYNLGVANSGADPFTPSWEIIGGYWQWGRKDQSASGPTSAGIDKTQNGLPPGWKITYAPNNSWTDAVKAADDPCPAGYRVPTKDQWIGVVTNNTWTLVGNWPSNLTNYDSGVKIGNKLFLPSAGAIGVNGISYLGGFASYWCSTEFTSKYGAYRLGFNGGTPQVSFYDRSLGFSVRCIEE